MKSVRKHRLHAAAVLALSLSLPGWAGAMEGNFTLKYDASLGRLSALRFGVNAPANTTLGVCDVLDSTTTFSSFNNGTAGFAWADGSSNSTVTLGRCDVSYTTAPNVGDFSLTLLEAVASNNSDLRSVMIGDASPLLMSASWVLSGVPGDVYPQGNPDGTRTIMDALTAFRMVMLPGAYPPDMKADVYPLNATDGTLTIMDALTIFRAVMGTVTLPESSGGGDTALRVVGVANQAPMASAGSLNVIAGGSVNGTLIASDADQNTLTYQVVSQPSQGTVTLNSTSGSYSYSARSNATGADSFTFKAHDGITDSNTATITVTISAVNDDPVVSVGNDRSVNENDAVSLNANASDVDGSISGYQWQQTAGPGVTLSNGGVGASVQFIAPLVGSATVLTFEAIATDDQGGTGRDSLLVTVNPVARVITIGSVSVTEGDSGSTNATVPVSLNLPAVANVTVSFVTSDNGALSGSDYSAVNGTLAFHAGESSGFIAVPVLGDTLDEANEVVTVNLSNPVGATLGNSTGSVTIQDDDPEPTLAFASASSTVTEGNSAAVSVTLNAPSALDITVPFTLSGSAENGTDYTVNSTSPVTIPAGQVSGGIHLAVLTDNLTESGENLTLTLGNPTYATLGSLSSHTLAIEDAIQGGYAPVARTGQTVSYAAGDDGDLQKGVAWPDPRFDDHGDGTITDNLTGLIWLKNGNCFGSKAWAHAISSANSLASGACGLSDGSAAGDWRLPNALELWSLIDYANLYPDPGLPRGHPFSGVVSDNYWSSSTDASDTREAWLVDLRTGHVGTLGKIYDAIFSCCLFYVWPVRGGQ
ncbi:MAG: DUF1566 domain-containing protein [Magnetococcus sp. WYHC-3]